tara:strand:+ start:26 stop:919 length:894 start_codon:yes stop_codon:yes gene_type:complete
MVICIDSINVDFVKSIFKKADSFIENPTNIPSHNDKILCNMFFEPSTRTMLSFESAMYKLNGKVINFKNDISSIKKGESIKDTLKTLEHYADIFVIRHPSSKIIFDANTYMNKPVINAGNGDSEHPTQALIDTFTIHKFFNFLNTPIYKKIKLLFIGDIKHSRTIHSLYKLLHSFFFHIFDIRFINYHNCYDDNLMNEDNTETNFDNIHTFDVIYCTRVQKERFVSYSSINYDDEIKRLQINSTILNNIKKNAIILHPLPRNNEIDILIDDDIRCKFFDQVKYGVFVRMAIIDAAFS